MDTLLVLPLLLPLLLAILSIINWGNRLLHRLLALGGAAGLLLLALALLANVRTRGILHTNVGNWPPPFAIVLVADMTAALMVLMTAIVGLAVVIYSFGHIDARRERFGYYPLLLTLLTGMCGAFLAGDIFNLYVWFEILLISSFALLALGGERGQLEGSVKYFALNLLVSVFFLAGVGFLYGRSGSLNMAQLALALNEPGQASVDASIAIFFMVAFGIKAAMFPLFFWLPASYHTPPLPIAAIFAGLLTKVGVYAMLRMFTLLFTQDVAWTHGLLLAGAALTMLVGMPGALASSDLRRVLSWNLVSHIGYMIMGLALYTSMALAGALFYIAHHMVVMAGLFLISGIAQRVGGSFSLARLGGLYRSHAGLALLFLLAALSLAGVPPFSGFWGKLLLLRAALEEGQAFIAGVALLVSALTLLSMTQVWMRVFWRRMPADTRPAPPMGRGERRALYAPVIALAALSVGIGLLSGPLLMLAQEAAAQLLEPAQYIGVVLGEGAA